MVNQGIVVPYLEYENLAKSADGIIAEHHPSRQLPIPVEEIIDTGLHIDVFPLPGLTKALADNGVVAFVNSSLDLITVDHDAWESSTPRYRFSIAHELGHIVLHKAVFAQLKVESLEEWKQAMKSIPKEQYARLEWQANAFAGHLLVPTTELRANLDAYVEEIEKSGLDPRNEAVRPFVEKHLGGVFRASSPVIHIRLDREGLWSELIA